MSHFRILDAQGHLPLPELLRLLTPTPFFIPDPNFTFAFLLSARIFVSPLEIMQKVFEESFLSHGFLQMLDLSFELLSTPALPPITHFRPPVSLQPSGATPNLVAFLSDWVELFPYDFREEPMMENLKSITKQCVARYEAHKKDVSPILQKLLDKLSSLEKHEEYIKEINKSSKPKTWSEHPPNRDIISVCPSPLDLAQQLTLVELRRLVYVGPEEIVYCLWRDPTISLPKALEKELAIAHANIRMANLEFYVDWFNRLSYLVASEICQYQRKRHRAKAIEYWIQVARECFNLGNFNSLMAILSGLSLGPVSRLKKTWTRVHNTQLSVLEHQMSPDSNFASYRSTLAAAKWRRSGAENGKVVADEQQERRKIIIPVFSVLIKDLQHTFQGCCHRLECGDFDFRSFSAMSEVVKELTDWQKVKCPFVEKEEVTTYLIHSPVFTETGLTLASFSCELPETEADKTRFKTLKSKMNAPNVDVTPTPALK
ncbi:unnamed protein product [Cyprideis torosa]|uniref:Uncharacterized protein n=1 Tax=Cyprideis torosa TaxID=163714 RepID=A0A7R8WG85_9CRUS|nr:unnamed protein product [Cyprideis torosa]CAG0892664.1 unnamed protein product [Cyprideis torosa]